MHLVAAEDVELERALLDRVDDQVDGPATSMPSSRTGNATTPRPTGERTPAILP